MNQPVSTGLVLLLLFGACSRGASSDGPAPPASSNPTASLTASGTSSAPAPGPSAVPPGASGAARAWQGTYKSVESTITLPQGVGWKVPPVAAGVGDGAIALTVDPSNGRARGTIDGVLGPATIDGMVSDARLTATVARQDPSDHGFTGTLDGELSPTAGHGTIHAALADVSAVRTATFELAPTAAGSAPPAPKP
jgi:hypothetical protein